jgi:hypothetical protein
MAVKGPYEIVHRYIGLSTDTKPTERVMVGDEFFETNTRLWYIYNGSNWSQKVSTASGTDVYYEVSDPATNAATANAIVDAYSGSLITLTGAGNSQTLANPTIITAGKIFTVINNDTSTHSIAVIANSVTFTITPGEAQSFVWDGSTWGPTDIGIISLPVTVPQGGTGLATLTANTIYKGNGTSAIATTALSDDGSKITSTEGIAFSGAFTKGVDFASAAVTMSDADNCLLSYGTWNDEVDVGAHTAHFVPFQVHMHSTSASAFDIAAMRLRVDTDGDNTGAAVQVLQLRQSLSNDTASVGTMGAGLSVDAACNVDTGEVVVGGFSVAGAYKPTTSAPNKVTVLQACNWNTYAGTSVNYLIDAYQNGAGNTVDALIRGNVIAGTATVGIEVANTSGTITTGLKFTGTIGTDISLQNGETITNTTNGTIDLSGHLRLAASQNLNINNATANGDLAGGIIVKSGIAASAAVTDGVQLYSRDVGGVATKAGLHMYNEAGDSGPVGWANIRIATRADANGTIGANEMYGQTHICSYARTYTLPPAVVGMNAKFRVTAAVVVSIDTDATGTTDAIILDGTELTAGNKITSDGVAYSTVYLECSIADHWDAYTIAGTWADGGA